MTHIRTQKVLRQCCVYGQLTPVTIVSNAAPLGEWGDLRVNPTMYSRHCVKNNPKTKHTECNITRTVVRALTSYFFVATND